MRYDKKIIEKVKLLRSRGKTYSEIGRHLRAKIPKSTLSSWSQDIKMPAWYQKKVDELNKKNFSKAQKMSLASNKIKQEKLIEEIIQQNKHLSQYLRNADILKIILAILYLGEGAKWKSHRGLMLGSSDSHIIQLYIRLLKKCYGLKLKNLKCRISYRADQNISDLQRYWSRVTSISAKNFYKTIPDPRTIGRMTKRKDYKGVCVITCAGTIFQRELEMIPYLLLKKL